MKKEEVQSLKHGLYKIYWKSGGSSLAAVGSLHNGSRWLAPTNWTASIENPNPTSYGKVWKDVKKVKLIKSY